MHPAPSIIVFTVLAGAGYGLVMAFGLVIWLFELPIAGQTAAVTMLVALIFITLGLSSSVLHLRRPLRARLALSQWRSSWLSREGVAALVTFVPLTILLGCHGLGWSASWLADTALIASVVGATVTILCTAMIYASLRSVPDWHRVEVPILYLFLALMTGSLILLVILVVAGFSIRPLIAPLIVMALLTWALKLFYWWQTTSNAGPSTAQTATGLRGFLRHPYPPHSETNYLLEEMGFRIGRKHRRKLRRYALILGVAVSCSLLALTSFFAPASSLASLLALLALIAGLLAVFIERWLFFAEARHTMMFYYDGIAEPGAVTSR